MFAVVKIISVFSIFMTSGLLSLFAQNEGILDKFTGSQVDGRVYLNWVITSGRTCDGTRIFRSTDSLSFTQIGDIQGICGSESSPQPFSFTDENPVKNQTNYYRLELGNIGYSDIVAIIMYDFGNRGYLIKPNPVTDKAEILFTNPKREQHQLTLYDQRGNFISAELSNENYFTFYSSGLSAGVYLFFISNVDKPNIISGKIIVEH